jgi:hypothetical protein
MVHFRVVEGGRRGVTKNTLNVIPCSELSSGLYCRGKWYNPEDNSEHHTRRRENLKSHM